MFGHLPVFSMQPCAAVSQGRTQAYVSQKHYPADSVRKKVPPLGPLRLISFDKLSRAPTETILLQTATIV